MNAILIVDDNRMNLRLLSDMLLSRGYLVEVASSGPEALAKARETPFDLILMDVQMAGMSGTEVMERLKCDPDWPRAPILAVTAMAMKEDEARLRAAGFDGYISKPVMLKNLLETVEAFLRERTGLLGEL